MSFTLHTRSRDGLFSILNREYFLAWLLLGFVNIPIGQAQITPPPITAPQGTLTPGFAACDSPIVLDHFYGLNTIGWKVSSVHVQGNWMVGVARPKTGNMERYATWVQDLGSNGVLDPSDYNFNQLHYIHTFDYPPNIKVSKHGLVAFIAPVPDTQGREFPDPTWTGSPPVQPMVSVMPDAGLYTCYAPACGQTIREVIRFTPKYHVAYVGPTNFMLDGAITEFHWDESFSVSQLVYSYTQYDNNIIQNPPWLSVPPSPLPTPPSPHTAIKRLEPFSGYEEVLAHRVTGGGVDGSSYFLTKSAQSPFVGGGGLGSDYMAIYQDSSLTLSGGIYSMEFFHFHPDTSPSATQLYQLDPIQSWADGPNTPGWAGSWQSSQRYSAIGRVDSAVNGDEIIAIRTVIEQNAINSQLRDVVFKSSLNNFSGPDRVLTSPNDNRVVNSVFAMDHPTPPIPSVNKPFMVAIDTQPLYNMGQARTQLYYYQPSSTAGAAGQFLPYKEVLVQGGGAQTFWLWGAGGTHVYGLLDTYNTMPATRDWALINCP